MLNSTQEAFGVNKFVRFEPYQLKIKQNYDDFDGCAFDIILIELGMENHGMLSPVY